MPSSMASGNLVSAESRNSSKNDTLVSLSRRDSGIQSGRIKRAGAGFRILGGKPASARPPVKAKVLECFKTEGVACRRGFKGA
jgi:hypothetical protein